LEVQPGPPRKIRRSGHLGLTPHFYVDIFDRQSRVLNLNGNADAAVVVVPGDYVYPNDSTDGRFVSDLISKTRARQIYFLAPDAADAIWPVCRQRLKDAFAATDHVASAASVAASPPGDDGPRELRATGVITSNILHSAAGGGRDVLDRTVIPEIAFINVSAQDAVKFVGMACRDFAPAGESPLTIRLETDQLADVRRISLRGQNVSVRTVVDAITNQTGLVCDMVDSVIVIRRSLSPATP
jgi:hypothetical protein